MKRFFCFAFMLMVFLASFGVRADYLSEAQNPTIEEFVGEYFKNYAEKAHVPGMTFGMVQDGEVVLLQGYGLANIDQKKPVDPERTSFRIGSITKTITAIAVLQLAEKGKLDLHEDINVYLPEKKFPESFSEPITAAHLLVMTSGIDHPNLYRYRKFLGTTLSEWVPSSLPARVDPPGTVFRYSNISYVLLGYLVELRSGMPFAEYVQKNILQPLGMEGSGFAGTGEESNHATGYRFRNGRLQGVTEKRPLHGSEGYMTATASDMVKYMFFLLEKQNSGGTRLLEPKYKQKLLEVQYKNHEKSKHGRSMGFFTSTDLESPRVFHGGGTYGFSSELVLFPEKNAGFYFSVNQFTILGSLGTAEKFVETLKHEITTRFFAQEKVAPLEPIYKNPNLVSSTLKGCYRLNRHCVATFEKTQAVFEPAFCVSSVGKDHIVIGEDKLRSISPSSFQLEKTKDPKQPLIKLTFRSGENSSVAKYAFLNGNVFERLSWYERTSVQRYTAIFCGIVFLLALFYYGFSFLNIRFSKKTGISKQELWTRIYSTLLIVCNFGFVVAIYLYFYTGLSIPEIQTRGFTNTIFFLLSIPFISVILTSIVAFMAVWFWVKKSGSLIQRILHSTVALCAILFLSQLSYWNLLGFKLPGFVE